MLILTRKENESIMVGDQIEIIITKVESDRVKVGIKAPSFISVHRKEVYEDIRKENIAAVRIDIGMLQEASQFLQKKKKEVNYENSCNNLIISRHHHPCRIFLSDSGRCISNSCNC